jgi:DNA-binding MarR family transcriptional regulator
MSTRPPDAATTELGDAFMSVSRELRHRQAAALEPFGLNPSEGRALRVLLRHQPMRLGDLASWLRVVPRSATDVADSLERLGLARREPDPADRRATLLSLTPAGTKLMQEIAEARQRQATGFFDRLSATDRTALARILAALATTEDYNGAGRPSK